MSRPLDMTRRRRPFRALLIATTIAVLGACGGDRGTDPDPSISIDPLTRILAPSASQQFTAAVTNGGGEVVWTVNGVAGGNATVGTISSTGMFTAPATAPAPNLVRVEASLASRPEVRAIATVSVAQDRQAGTWLEMEPRVLERRGSEPLTLTLYTDDSITRAALDLDAGGSLEFTRHGERTFRAAIPAAQVLSGHADGRLHVMLGSLDLFQGATVASSIPVVAKVRDATVPDVAVTRHADDLQSSARILNLRRDEFDLSRYASAAAVSRFYATLPDDYDFLAVVEPVISRSNRFLQATSNQIQGIGLPLYNDAGAFGSAGRLQGIVRYANDGFFDLADHHEIGHRFANHLNHPRLAPSRTHWPLSTMAYGLIGYHIAGTEVGGEFPWGFEPVATGGYRVRTRERMTKYNDLELYLMGLIPASQVAPHLVFENQAQGAALTDGMLLEGGVEQVRIEDIIAVDGPRVPAAGTAPTSFRVGTLVLSTGRLLTATEMAFFDYMARRGEWETDLTVQTESGRRQVKPFYPATGERARLVTTLR